MSDEFRTTKLCSECHKPVFTKNLRGHLFLSPCPSMSMNVYVHVRPCPWISMSMSVRVHKSVCPCLSMSIFTSVFFERDIWTAESKKRNMKKLRAKVHFHAKLYLTALNCTFEWKYLTLALNCFFFVLFLPSAVHLSWLISLVFFYFECPCPSMSMNFMNFYVHVRPCRFLVFTSRSPHWYQFCQECVTVWNRDVNAGNNILYVALCALEGRPVHRNYLRSTKLT